MTETEKAIRDFCGHHADWWPSTTQVQEMLALAQPAHGWTPERIAGMARLKEAQDKKLAESEKEPVAWRAWVSKFPQGTGNDWVYVTKPIMKDSIHNQPLYTTPPQRTWVGLTDEEITTTSKETHFEPKPVAAFAQAIEAKLRSKNEN